MSPPFGSLPKLFIPDGSDEPLPFATSRACSRSSNDAAGDRRCSCLRCSVTVTIAVMIGPVSIRPRCGLARRSRSCLVPGWLSPTWQPFEASIIWDVRLPRVLLASIVGAGLAVVGAALQALLRNPLADPYLLGTSAGAALGRGGRAALRSVVLGGISISAAAFAGALAGDGRRLRAGLAVRPISYCATRAQWRGGVVPVLVDDESADLPRSERGTSKNRALLDARRPGCRAMGVSRALPAAVVSPVRRCW